MKMADIYKTIKEYGPDAAKIGGIIMSIGCGVTVDHILSNNVNEEEMNPVKCTFIRIGCTGIGIAASKCVSKYFEAYINDTINDAEPIFNIIDSCISKDE